MSAGQLVDLATGETFPLGFEPVTIGRHAENRIVLADQEVSRHHAEILMRAGRWVIRDQGSANGTFVNGERIDEPRVLEAGDTIRLGHTSFLVELPARIADQDTLLERRPVYVPPAPVARSSTPWLTAMLALAATLAVVAILVSALVIWPRLRGEVAEPHPTIELVSEAPGSTAAFTPTAAGPTSTPIASPPPPEPTDTASPTLAPPTLEPSPTPTVPPPPPSDTPPPSPVIGFFRADRTTIEKDQCVRLEWGQVEHATRVTLVGVGLVNLSGKLDVCMNETRTFVLQAEGMGGTAEKKVQITVHVPAGPVIEYLRVVPSIISPDDCAQLEWGKVDQATSAEIEPDIGGVATPGNVEVCPDSTTTYVLVARGISETNTAETTLTVSSDTGQIPVIPYFTANPARIRAGECTVLSWGKVDYATSVTINYGIGGVATPESREVCLATTTTFVMTAVGPGGSNEYDVTVTVSPGQLANLPDLVVESILFEPNPCYRGQACKVRVKVRNDGPVDAGRFMVRWAPVGMNEVPVEWDMDRLGTGREMTLNYTWVPERAEDNWRTVAVVDAFDDVAEIEEGEANSLDQFITVLQP
jgi:pSer/pThr/pTyr-binding forkhead associated (FHA) protein